MVCERGVMLAYDTKIVTKFVCCPSTNMLYVRYAAVHLQVCAGILD